MNTLSQDNAFRLESHQQEALKYLAMGLMVFDHLMHAFNLPKVPWHIPGRLVLPIFAFLIAYNMLYNSSNTIGYISRLSVFALISQLPYMWFFGYEWYNLNIFGTLLVGALLVYGFLSVAHFRPLAKHLLSAAMIGVAFALSITYNIFGVLTIAAFYAVLVSFSISRVFVLFLVVFMINIAWGPVLALAGMCSVIVIYFAKELYSVSLPRMPKFFAYLFYPFHLVAIKGFALLF